MFATSGGPERNNADLYHTRTCVVYILQQDQSQAPELTSAPRAGRRSAAPCHREVLLSRGCGTCTLPQERTE